MEPRTWSGGAGVIALVAAMAAVAVQTMRLDAARTEAVRAALVSDSLEAERDTSRIVSLHGAFADSLRVVERRAVQARQRSDSLDHALGSERAAQLRLAATVPVLNAAVRSDTVFVTEGDSVRRARFHVYEAPYTVDAEVALPRAPSAGKLILRVEQDTLDLDVRVECGAPRNAVRPASVAVIAPGWATVRLGRVEQSPAVCNQSSRPSASGRWSLVRGLRSRFGVGVQVAAVRLSTGVVVVGPGVGVGVRIWP